MCTKLYSARNVFVHFINAETQKRGETILEKAKDTEKLKFKS